ncbi:MAG TPA: glycosyltransferase family 2 protein [Armatimonadota bacterium]|nr:glycosyltransferase family 2 protein [Armatimonadota bacterium]
MAARGGIRATRRPAHAVDHPRNWNTAELLCRCLETVLASPPGQEAEVVVVDNASIDDSVARVRERFPQVRVIQNPANVGFARANNQGAHECSGDVLLLLNTDTEVREGALEALTDFITSHDDVGIVGPRLVSPDGSVQSSCRTEPGLLNALLEALALTRLAPRSRLFGRPEMTWFDHHSALDVDYVSGACLAIRRELWNQLGGFDEGFFFYGEDADLCRRARQAGFRVAYFPEAEVLHLGGASAARVGPRKAIEGYRAALRFARKHHGRAYAVAMEAVIALGTALRLVASLPRRGEAARAQRQAYWAVLRWLFRPGARPGAPW